MVHVFVLFRIRPIPPNSRSLSLNGVPAGQWWANHPCQSHWRLFANIEHWVVVTCFRHACISVWICPISSVCVSVCQSVSYMVGNASYHVSTHLCVHLLTRVCLVCFISSVCLSVCQSASYVVGNAAYHGSSHLCVHLRPSVPLLLQLLHDPLAKIRANAAGIYLCVYFWIVKI